MSFLYPLGLLGLIGIPIVILIYILRSKYNEQTVSSTYLWELSEKFFKRRNPLSGLTGIISLILQILTVLVVSLAIARPIFVMPNSASEYCFVIDATGSMNIKDGTSTRFDEAKRAVKEKIDGARLGSSYTLVYASAQTSTVYERITDKKIARQMLDELECTDGTSSPLDAMAKAQEYFDENPSTLVYFFTDKDYETHENLEIVNVSVQNTKNYSLYDVTGSVSDGILTVDASVLSHNADATLKLELYIDGSKNAASSVTVSAEADTPTTATLTAEVAEYISYRLVITNKDGLMSDNEFIGYNMDAEDAYSILIVSETPFFLEAAFDALTDSAIDTVSPAAYNGQTGYGLYVFHSFTPETLPDAPVWLINSTKSVDDSGFSTRGPIEIDGVGELVKSESTATQARKLLSGIDGRDIYLTEYTRYGGMYTRFTTLFSYGADPLIFAGINGLGNREVVFAFDLHKSDISLSSDFAPLISNLLYYSCPDFLENTAYYCGEEVEMNVTAGINTVKAILPGGEEKYIDTSSDIASLILDKVGTYTVEVETSEGNKSYKLYSSMPKEESVPDSAGDNFSLVGERQFERTDGEYDPLTLLFILLAIIFVADWMVYCYEKYQLR